MDCVAILPSYKPDGRLLTLIDELKENDIGVLVVDDGSGEDYKEIFKEASRSAAVITHKENRGKGAALKTGIAAVKEVFPDCSYFITADSDGQHRISDILRVVEELRHGARFVLSTRRFNKREMPFTSRLGNNLSRVVYCVLTGHYFTDNQSGLRGFSVSESDWLLKVGGEKYDYEMNMLYYADKQRIPITTVPIEAVYIDGNKSSHFDPAKDTLCIYRQLFKSAAATFISFAAAEFAVALISFTIGYWELHISLPSVGASVAMLDVLINRFVTFRGVKYADTARTVIYTVLRYAAYTVGCLLLRTLFLPYYIPLFLSYNIIMAAVVPFEYILHKLIRYGRYRDIIKDQ